VQSITLGGLSGHLLRTIISIIVIIIIIIIIIICSLQENSLTNE